VSDFIALEREHLAEALAPETPDWWQRWPARVGRREEQRQALETLAMQAVPQARRAGLDGNQVWKQLKQLLKAVASLGYFDTAGDDPDSGPSPWSRDDLLEYAPTWFQDAQVGVHLALEELALLGGVTPAKTKALPWEGPAWDLLPRQQQLLLSYMHGKPRADAEDAIEAVWGGAHVNDQAIHTAVSRANTFLHQVSYHQSLHYRRGIISWYLISASSSS
jgi:hypothetical protein